MKKKNSNYRSISKVLNTSSETFMLIALLALFALPFVIASNLEPGVKGAEKTAQIVRPQPPVAVTQAPELALQTIDSLPVDQNVALAEQNPSVLGVESVNQPFEIIEEKEQFGFFNTAQSNLGQGSYTLNIVKTNKDFGKISLFKLTNNSAQENQYSLEIIKNKADSKLPKYISLNFQEYQVGSAVMPKKFTLAPKEEMWFGVRSNDGKATTDLTLKVGLVE